MKHHRVVHEGARLSPYTYHSALSRGSSVDYADSPTQPLPQSDSDVLGSPQSDHDVFHGSLIEAIYQQRMLAAGHGSECASSESGVLAGVGRSASSSLPYRGQSVGLAAETSGELSMRSDGMTNPESVEGGSSAALGRYSDPHPSHVPGASSGLEQELEEEEKRLEALSTKLSQRNIGLSHAVASNEDEAQYLQTKDAILSEQRQRHLAKQQREEQERMQLAHQQERAQMEDYIRHDIIQEAVVECGLVAHEAAMAAMADAELQSMIDDDADRRQLAREEAERLSRQRREALERAYYECQDPLLRSLREAGQSRREHEAAVAALEEETELHELEARLAQLAKGRRPGAKRCFSVGAATDTQHADIPSLSSIPYWKKRLQDTADENPLPVDADTVADVHPYTKRSREIAGIRTLTAAQAVAAVESWEVPQLLAVIENAADATGDVGMRGLGALLLGISGV